MLDLLTQAEVMNMVHSISYVFDLPINADIDIGHHDLINSIHLVAMGTTVKLRKRIRDAVVSMPAGLETTRADRISDRRLSKFAHLIVHLLRRIKHRFSVSPPLGWVRFGSLSRTQPISEAYGFDRGQPVDRLYVEQFLARQAPDVRGRVLEFSDRVYTRRFGGKKVIESDVMDLEETNKRATVVGDLTAADHIPSNTFDCIICTQMLGLLYDVRAGMKTLHRILKPGGVLLLTVGGITRVGREDWKRYGSYWRFTSLAIQKLLEECFPAPNVKVESFGNVYAAIAFLSGVAVEELHTDKLLQRDIHYQVVIAARGVKRASR